MKYFLFLLFFCVSYSCAILQQSKLEKYSNVRYRAFTKENPNVFVDIRDVVDYNSNLTTVFIVHGFFTKSMKKPLKVKDDTFKYNPDVGCVIVVYWLDYSMYSDTSSFKIKSSNYNVIAKTHVRHMVKDIKEKLQYVHKRGVRKIEMIGHDVGAHAVGRAARFFKKKTGHKVDRIIGLDPAAPFFKDNPILALKQSDAKSVKVFHTNTDKYGLGNEIGSNDTFVNGGKKQPECKRKLTDNICSHNRGWEVYSNSLKKSTKGGRLRSHRFVLCIDVSGSMDENSRLIRAISSAKKLLSSIKDESYIGIVTFSDEAMMSHDIIQLKDKADRLSLISKLPTRTIGSTNIGGGLNLSMTMLKMLPQSEQFCSTIILLSDGIQNVGTPPQDVLPELQKSCIGVNSVALGAQASDDLESISLQTDGTVIYAKESNNAQQITDTDRSFSFSYENEIDADIRPIYLPTVRVTLKNGENVIPFVMDENIGKDTELTFTSDDIKNVDLSLISPTGQRYTSTSPEYVDNSSNMQKSFKIPFAETGEWQLVANKVIKTRRSIRSTSFGIFTVKTHQLDDDVPPVRLDASVSKRILEYPKSDKQSDIEEVRILIFAELRRGRYPIIHAKVLGHIQGLNDETVTFQLRDDGAFPDELANDGVYTASIVKLGEPQRYSVFVTASNSNRNAKLVPKEIDYFERELIDCNHINCETLSNFERETYVGSIKLISKDNEDRIPPNPITDLRATVYNETERLIALEWTSPVDEAFDMHIKEYDIRVIDGQDFENAFRFNASHFVGESFDAKNSDAERLEKCLLRVPNEIWKYDKKHDEPGFFVELKFAMKTIGANGETSPRSNLALVEIEDRPFLLINFPNICKKIRKKNSMLRRNSETVYWFTIVYC